MGDNGFTCAISGLPIPIGGSAIAFLLTQTPYEDHNRRTNFYLHDEWFLRTPPLRTTIDEFHRLRCDDEVMQSIWAWGFQQDLVEKDTGDFAIKKGEDFDHYMWALKEGKLEVCGEIVQKGRPTQEERRKREEEGWNPWYPTVDRVRQALALPYPEVIVDEVKPGIVRVREPDSFEGESLDAIRTLLGQLYETVLTQTDGDYCVLAMPGRKAKHAAGWPGSISLRESAVRYELAVRLMVIRQDAWNGVARLGAKLKDEDKEHQAFRKELQATAKAAKGLRAPIDLKEVNGVSDELKAQVAYMHELALRQFASGLERFMGSHIPFRMHIGEHLKELFLRGQAEPYFPILGQLRSVEQMMSVMGHSWRPSNGCQGYDEHHASEIALYELFARLAKKTRRSLRR